MPEITVSPATPSSAQKHQRPGVELCRDIYAGTRRMREKATTYLPQFPLESAGAYRSRLAQSVLWNGFARTIEGLTGMVMAKPPKLGPDVPGEIVGNAAEGNAGGLWENIDNAGTHGDVFAADRLTDALIDGHVCILVDAPKRDPEVRDRGTEIARGIRPYWVTIRKDKVLRARTGKVKGRDKLVRFAFEECFTEPDGEYGESAVEQVRELWIDGAHAGVQFRVMRKRTVDDAGAGHKAGEWYEFDAGAMDIDEIPVATIYASRKSGAMESEPPLEDLAHENVGHYQILSDYRNSLHVAGIPIALFIGLADGEAIKWAADSAIALPTGGDGKYMEPAGTALSAFRQELQDTQLRMASLGLAMLQQETRATETAEGKRIDAAAANSALARVAANLDDGLEEALRFTAMWLGLGEDAGGSVSTNREFEALVMSPAEIAEWRNLVADKRISIETLWDALKRGRWLPEGFDEKVEKDRLEQEAAKNPPVDPLAGLRGRFVKPPKPGDPAPDPNKPDPNDPKNDPNARK